MTDEHGKRAILVVGAGFVGLASAAVLAQRGHDVIVVDIDEHRILDVVSTSQGQGPEDGLTLDEPGLGEALRPARFVCGDVGDDEIVDALAAVNDGCLWSPEFVVVAVGTPMSQAKLGLSTSALFTVVEAAYNRWPGATIIVRSTITPSDAFRLQCTYGERIMVVPEFLREGHALMDACNPHRLVVGSIYTDRMPDLQPVPRVKQVARLFAGPDMLGGVHFVSIPEAAFIKLASNAMLSMRVEFADGIADFCERRADMGMDADRILTGIGADIRIGHGALSPGMGVGGPCLPKDRLAFEQLCGDEGWRPTTHWFDRHAIPAQLGAKGIKHIVFFGLGFKPDSTDYRDSPMFEAAKQCLLCDMNVYVYDPRVSRWPQPVVDTFGAQRLLTANLMSPGLSGQPNRWLRLPFEKPEDGIAVVVGFRMTPELSLVYSDGKFAEPRVLIDPYRLIPSSSFSTKALDGSTRALWQRGRGV